MMHDNKGVVNVAKPKLFFTLDDLRQLSVPKDHQVGFILNQGARFPQDTNPLGGFSYLKCKRMCFQAPCD